MWCEQKGAPLPGSDVRLLPTTPPRCGRAAAWSSCALRDLGVAKGLLGDALYQVAELKGAMRALRVAES